MQPVSSNNFDTLYKSLNAEQKKAVDAVEGPVMVIAGPGTGKTHMLTLRIANILRRTDTTPDNILALTFTESAAHGMRARLLDIIGPAAYRVHIHTFHGFCNGIIERHPDAFPRIIGSVHAADIDQIRIVEEAVASSRLKFLKPYGKPYHYVIDVLNAIRELKREAITPGSFRGRLSAEKKAFAEIPDRYYEKGRYKGRLKGKYAAKEAELGRLSELLVLYRKYEAGLAERRLYDYEDMIIETVAVLEKNESLLLRLQERYQYILADEHQDANNGQNRLLALLASFHENPNLFVVGDEKQAIFRFQGASLENFLSFARAYPDALIVQLKNNYRSRQFVLDAARSVILHNAVSDPRLQIELKSAADHRTGPGDKERNTHVQIFALSTPVLEQWFVAQDIAHAISIGVRPEEIAILYRDNRDVEPFAASLDGLNVPYTIFSDASILADPEIEKFITLLRAIDAPHRGEVVGKALFIDFLGIEPYDAYGIFNALSRHGSSKKKGEGSTTLHDVLRSRSALEDSGVRDPQAVMRRYAELLSWSAVVKNKGLMDALEIIARESGFLAHLLHMPDGHVVVRKFDRLLAEFVRVIPGTRAYDLHDALRHIDTLAYYGVALKARADETAQSEGVRLMTAHKAKGLEFDRVYIVGATDGHWGNRRRTRVFSNLAAFGDTALSDPVESEDVSDERRLFYVALTRARHDVYISYSRNDANGTLTLPSQFVEEIDPAHVRSVSTEALEADLHEVRNAARLRAGSTKAALFKDSIGEEEKAKLRELFDHRAFSVSALNNYLQCPWKYFFENLIRLPHAPNRHQLYGIAIHAAMKKLYDDVRSAKRTPSKARTIDVFKQSLVRQPLSVRDFEDSLEKGKQAIGGYFDTYKGAFDAPLETEFAIRGIILDIADSGAEGGEVSVPIRLTGILDKMSKEDTTDEASQSRRRRVRVVDYKTGKPRSRNYIEGNTKDSTGDYKRQLVFYKLLLDRFADGMFEMVTGEIDFVEPDPRGRYHRERFTVTDVEVRALEHLIGQTVINIRSLSFWNARCNDVKCAYCALRQMMRK